MGAVAGGAVVVLFDDDCGFCRWSLDRMMRWDRDGVVEPVALQTRRAAELLAGMDPGDRMASWHVVLPGGRRYSGGDAIAPLLRRLPPVAWLAPLFTASPTVTRAFYRVVVRNRERLGRLLGEGACSVRPGGTEDLD